MQIWNRKTVNTYIEWVEPSISPTTKDLRGVDDTKASAPDDRQYQSMKNLNRNIYTIDSTNLVVYKTPANIVKRQKTSAKNISRKGWLRYKWTEYWILLIKKFQCTDWKKVLQSSI